MFILDRGFGLAMKYLQDHAKGGYVGHHNYILHQTNEDILIFGSSRAIHHYNPQIVKDSLGMSCYNCGQDGNGIVLFYGWWQLIKDRYHPKMIIYDVNPDFDLILGEDNSKYLGWLRSEYDNNDIKKIFARIDPTERFKMLSMMYRYNSKFLQNITDYVHPLFQISSNGYLPLTGEMDQMKVREKKESQNYQYDSLKLKYLERIIEETKVVGTDLVFVVSPSWYGMDEKVLSSVYAICKRKGIALKDFSNDVDFVHNNRMFKDGLHLNAQGADEFTKALVKAIKY